MFGEETMDLNEKIEGLVNKSKKSGVAYGILKKVYNRGMGHGELDIDQALLHNNGRLQE